MDGAIEVLAPKWALSRRAARDESRLRAMKMEVLEKRVERLKHWNSAGNNRLRDHRWLGSELSVDSGLDEDLEELQLRCSEAYRDNTVAHSAIEGRVTHEVGSGISGQGRVRETLIGPVKVTKEQAALYNRQLEDVVQRWSQHGVDSGRRHSFGQIQRLVCRTFSTYGEAFIEVGVRPFRGPISLAMKVIDPRRVETPPDHQNNPNVRLGIRYDRPGGEVIGYYVRKVHPGDSFQTEYGHDYIPRFDKQGKPRMLHVFDPIFPEQSRGIPWLAAALNRIKDLDDFFEAELIAKQIEACFGILIKKDPETTGSLEEEAERVASETVSNQRLEDIEPGMVEYMNTGEDITTIDPQRPGSTFAPFLEAALRSISGALNFPYEILAKNFFRTTFSSGRLALLDGAKGFRMRSSVLCDQFLSPVWNLIVEDAFFYDQFTDFNILDYRDAPEVFQKHAWQHKTFGFIDMEKEFKAYSLAKKDGLAPMAAIYEAQESDWESAMEQIFMENEKELENEIRLRVRRKELEESNDLRISEEAGQEEEEDSSDEKQPAGAGSEE